MKRVLLLLLIPINIYCLRRIKPIEASFDAKNQFYTGELVIISKADDSYSIGEVIRFQEGFMGKPSYVSYCLTKSKYGSLTSEDIGKVDQNKIPILIEYSQRYYKQHY